MAGILNAVRRAADVGRRAADRIGERPVTVTIVMEQWSAPHNTLGAVKTSTLSSVTLSPSPKVTAEGEGDPSAFGGDGGESASTGVLRASRYRIGPVTRRFPGGGYAAVQILTVPANPTQHKYVLLDDGGDNFLAGGERFIIQSCDVSRPHQITFIVARTDQT